LSQQGDQIGRIFGNWVTVFTLGTSMKSKESRPDFGSTFSEEKDWDYFWIKMGWDTFWAIFTELICPPCL
jgi:hypothetical protein